MKRGFYVAFVLLIVALLARSSFAGGSGVYPNGAEAFLVGVAPPPGFYFENYLSNYHADSMKDNSRNNIGAFDKLNVDAEVMRFIWISKHRILGGNYGQHLFIPLLHVSLDSNIPVGKERKKNFSDSGVPYIIYSPFILAHHFLGGKLHTVVSLVDIYIPTYGQDDNNLANVSHNYFTFEPVLAATYLPGNWEFSMKMMYDISTKQKNSPTIYGVNPDRKPGQEFHFDYSISYGLSKHLRAGISGFYYRQTTNDKYYIKNGTPAPVKTLLKTDESNKSEEYAVGPGIWYNYKNMFFSLREQFDLSAKNHTKGNTTWLKFIYAF